MLLFGIFSPLPFARGEGGGKGFERLRAAFRTNPHSPPLLWKKRGDPWARGSAAQSYAATTEAYEEE